MTPERWISLPSNPRYAVSNLGRVKSVARQRVDGRTYGERILKFSSMFNLYRTVKLFSPTGVKCATVHSLVAEAFIGPRSPVHEINHKDGIKLNNLPENLEYVTVSENKRHALRSGLMLSGGRHPQSKLTDQNVRDMRDLRRNGHSLMSLAQKFSVGYSTVQRIVSGASWRYLDAFTPHHREG